MENKLKPCRFCGNPPGTKVGPPALARCITPGCEGSKLGASTLEEWNSSNAPAEDRLTELRRLAEAAFPYRQGTFYFEDDKTRNRFIDLAVAFFSTVSVVGGPLHLSKSARAEIDARGGSPVVEVDEAPEALEHATHCDKCGETLFGDETCESVDCMARTQPEGLEGALVREERYLLDHLTAECGIMPGDIQGSFHRLREEVPNISVKTMRTSDGGADYYVSIEVGDREITPYKFREEFKAAYEADSLRWLLLGAEKPNLMAYDVGDWPGRDAQLTCGERQDAAITEGKRLARSQPGSRDAIAQALCCPKGCLRTDDCWALDFDRAEPRRSDQIKAVLALSAPKASVEPADGAREALADHIEKGNYVSLDDIGTGNIALIIAALRCPAVGAEQCGDAAPWRIKYLCETIIKDAVVDATKTDARIVLAALGKI